jgi:uncharacterized protein YkwD
MSKSRLRLAIAACLAVVSLAVVLPSPASAGAPSRADMFARINAARQHAGLPKVRMAPELQRATGAYAHTLARRGQFAHARNLRPRGSAFSLVGEILGMAPGKGGDAGGIVHAWLGSPDHRPILLGRRYQYVGIGVASGRMQGQTTTFWVVRFGRR